MRVDVSGPVATVVLPPTFVPSSELEAAGRQLTGGVRIVVVEIRHRVPIAGAPDWRGMAWLQRPDLISIAALSGAVEGDDLEFALLCDLRVATEDTLLAMTSTRAGHAPALAPVLADLIGPARALELCLTGRRVSAREAEEIGLIALTVPQADLDGAIGDLIDVILEAPREAVVETKALLRRARTMSDRDRWSAAAEAQARLVGKDA